MNAVYAINLCVQTLLALSGLGLLGGWALWPFRRDDRPYLWLAAPLAGIAVQGVSLSILVTFCRAPLPLVLPILLALGGCLTLWVCRQELLPWFRSPLTLVGVLVGLTVIGWAVYGSNRTALRHGEPTLCMQDGSDTIGYCQGADWYLYHLYETPREVPELPEQAWVAHTVVVEERPAAYLFPAAAAWLRSTRPVFSYDWCCGVALAAGVLGLAGLFASRPREFLLLAVAGMLSLWLPLSRSGYLAKLLCYPGLLLLCVCFLRTWREPTRNRYLLSAVLGLGVGLYLHAVVVQAVLSIVFLGAMLGLVVRQLGARDTWGLANRRFLETCWFVGAFAVFFLGLSLSTRFASMPYGFGLLAVGLGLLVLRRRIGARDSFWQWGEMTRGLLLYAAMVGPLFLYATFSVGLTSAEQRIPASGASVDWLVPMMLDLDGQGVPLVATSLRGWLLLFTLLATVGFLLIAWRGRNWEAVGLLVGVGVVPLAWVMSNHHSLRQFHGVLFPLTIAGVVLALQRLQKTRWGHVGLLFAVALVAVRLPQAYCSFDRYTNVALNAPNYFRESHIKQIVRAIGHRTVDVNVHDLHSAMVLLAELGPRNVHVQYRDPAWRRLVGYTGWPVPEYPAVAELRLADAHGWSAPGTTVFKTHQFKIADDLQTLSLLSLSPQQGTEVLWDHLRRPSLWLGESPSAIEIWNGSGQSVAAVLSASGLEYDLPATGVRVVQYELDGGFGEESVGRPDQLQIRLPLQLRPGINRLHLLGRNPTTSSPTSPAYVVRLTDLRLDAPSLGIVPAPQEKQR